MPILASRPTPMPLSLRFATAHHCLLGISGSARGVGTVDNRLDVVNEVYDTPIFVCRGLRSEWPETWGRMRFFS